MKRPAAIRSIKGSGIDDLDNPPKSAEDWQDLLTGIIAENSSVIEKIQTIDWPHVADKVERLTEGSLNDHWLVRFICIKADIVDASHLASEITSSLKHEKGQIDGICDAFDRQYSDSDMISKKDARRLVIDALGSGFIIGAQHAKKIEAVQELRQEKRNAGLASVESRRRTASEGWKLHAADLFRQIHLSNQTLSNRRLFQLTKEKWNFEGRPCPSDPKLQDLLDTLDDRELAGRRRRNRRNS